jgi:hypothetical protein
MATTSAAATGGVRRSSRWPGRTPAIRRGGWHADGHAGMTVEESPVVMRDDDVGVGAHPGIGADDGLDLEEGAHRPVLQHSVTMILWLGRHLAVLGVMSSPRWRCCCSRSHPAESGVGTRQNLSVQLDAHVQCAAMGAGSRGGCSGQPARPPLIVFAGDRTWRGKTLYIQSHRADTEYWGVLSFKRAPHCSQRRGWHVHDRERGIHRPSR